MDDKKLYIIDFKREDNTKDYHYTIAKETQEAKECARVNYGNNINIGNVYPIDFVDDYKILVIKDGS